MLQCDIKTVDSKNQALRCKRGSASSYQASGRFFISFRAYRRSFAAAAALYFGKNKLWIPACVLAVLMGFSRLYLYVHYPSDVLAAAMIGIMLGWFGNFLANGLWKKAIRHGKSLYN